MNDERNMMSARDDANREYFLTLAYGRFSLDGLPGMAFITALLLGVDVIPLASMVLSHGERMFERWFATHLVLIGLSLLLCLIGAAKSWVFRFQVLSTALMACLAAVGWVYALSLMMLSIASTVEDPAGGAMFSVPLLTALGAGGTVVVLGALVVHVWLLRRRLRDGHSRERTLGNLGRAMRAKGPKVVLIVAAAAFVVVNVATKGEYLLLISGTIGFLLLAAVAPSMLVEFVYLTHLKSRNHDFWEEAPPLRTVDTGAIAAVVKQVGKWTLIVLGVFLGLVLLGNPFD